MQSARKIGSRIGSITCLTTICATRSATVGTPKILSPPLFWGMETARTGGGKELPELIRFQILYRFPDKSASNCSIVCSSTPAAPRLDLTALYASYTRRFSIWNGLFVARIEIILFPVVSLMQPPNPTPLLQSHYTTFFARTSRSAPVLRIGTLASRFWPLGLLPSHRSDWFLQFRAIASIRFTPSIRRSPPAQSSGI